VLFWAKVANVADTTYISVANEPGATDRDDPMGIWVTSEGAVLAWWYSDANQDGPAPLSVLTGLVTNNTWAHVAVVFVPGTGVTVYVDGSTATTYVWQAGSTSFLATWETLLVGSSRWGSNYATIDDLRIFDEALTPGQISILMHEPVGGALCSGKIKVWDGTQWQAHSLKAWDGVTWVTHSVSGSTDDMTFVKGKG
jgi:hypothetical protein